MKTSLWIWGTGFDSKILFQTQRKPEAFEIICIGINTLNLIEAREFMGASGSVIESPVREVELSLDGEFIIKCERMFYRFAPELIGCHEHLGSQVPTPKMVKASEISEGWRQCATCSEA